MADTPQNLSAVTNALAQAYADEVARQVNRTSVALSILRIVTSPSSAKNVAWDVESDGAIAENFTDGADVSNYGSDVLTPATLNWGLIRSNFRVTNLAAAAAMRAQSPAEVNDLIGRNVFNSVSKLGSTINGQIYTGTGSGGQFVGLDLAIDSAGIYAGIDRSSATYWQSTEVDAAGAAITFGQIRSDLGLIYDASGFVPDIALCNTAMFNKVRALFDASVRFDRQVTTARGSYVLENSPEVIVIDGCQFVRDKDATANEIKYLNSMCVEIEVLPQVAGFASKVSSGDASFDNLMRGLYAYELGRTGSSRKMSIEAYLTLKCIRPNACGKRRNIG